MFNLLNEAYFKNFDMERICIDKVFFVVYDKKYSQEDHPFDTVTRDRYIQNIKRSRIGKGRFEEVMRRENKYSSWELQLRGPRVMYFHVNIIHFLQEIHDIKPQNVIYDDNYMPTDSKLTINDYIAALRRFIKDAMELYKDVVDRHWNVNISNIGFKIVEIEIPFEVYPASVDDIAQRMMSKGVAFRKYNTQSGTIYLDKSKFDNEITVDRKYDKITKMDCSDLTPDITYTNKINSGRLENKIQLKLYQKTFGLVRIEITAYSLDAKSIFIFSYSDDVIHNILVDYVHFVLKEHDIEVDRYDRCLDDIVQFLAVAFKENEDTIYSLKNVEFFEACASNRALRQRLVKKGLILKKFDSDNRQQRGVYLVNPIVKDFLNLYKSTGQEHFVKGGLYPDL